MDIRQSYEKINISEQAKNQIKNDILAGEKTVRKENGSGAYKKYGKIRAIYFAKTGEKLTVF